MLVRVRLGWAGLQLRLEELQLVVVAVAVAVVAGAFSSADMSSEAQEPDSSCDSSSVVSYPSGLWVTTIP